MAVFCTIDAHVRPFLKSIVLMFFSFLELAVPQIFVFLTITEKLEMICFLLLGSSEIRCTCESLFWFSAEREIRIRNLPCLLTTGCDGTFRKMNPDRPKNVIDRRLFAVFFIFFLIIIDYARFLTTKIGRHPLGSGDGYYLFNCKPAYLFTLWEIHIEINEIY